VKILYVITKSNWGGAQRHVYDLAVAMKTAGHEVKVALGGAGMLKDRLEAVGIFTYPISSLGRDISVGKDAGSLREIWKIIREQKPDILHLHSPKAAGLGAFVGRILRVPQIVMTVHGWTWNERRPFAQRLGIVFFSWLTALLCHKVIVISERDRSQGARLPGIRDKIVLIPLGIKPAALMSVDGAKQAMAKAVGLSVQEYDKRFVVGTIAELHPNKGLPYLVNAMADVVSAHPSALCLIAGDGQDAGKLSALIQARHLDKNVFLLGYVADAAEYLKAFSLFVLPSLKEGLPYVLMEAGAASLPVVATTVGGIPDIIQDMHSGILIQPRNTRELSHAILFAIEHPKERRDYGARLKEAVMSRFSLERMIDETKKVYTHNNEQ
jgi:glycosyltransferase involved in cell wall biosynthesis